MRPEPVTDLSPCGMPLVRRTQNRALAFIKLAFTAVTAFSVVTPESLQSASNFDREIRPILSEHCFPCHGPDAEIRKADLRLDTKEGLLGTEGSPGPFTPSNLAESEAFQRIISTDPDEIMPPPRANLPLSPQQVALLKQWVLDGADWQRHWAFEPISTPPLPIASDPTWIENEIDLFVQAGHQAANMQPASEAVRAELIRRLTLDLHGLPATADAIAEFVNDSRPDAYNRLLDRLLASPRYGERMVWDWLDAARYADSNGYQGDRERTMWPWRDWAASEFNRNTPFDEFTIKQLAGDLLPEPTTEQVLATGFNRNHMINGEGGRIPEENRIDYVMDMSETMGTVWLGLTVNCCRCHDHKFDPLSQRDYYGLFAFFNQTPVTGAGGNPQTAPIIELPSDTDLALRQTTTDEKEKLEEAIVTFERENRDLLMQSLTKPELEKIIKEPVTKRNDAQIDTLLKSLPNSLESYSSILNQLKSLRQRLTKITNRMPKVMVMADKKEPRETFLLNRGLYNNPGEAVTAATPTSLPPMPLEAPRNRLGLAQWLVDETNPLTSRVFVNRQWALFFGQGLVTTPEDFGSQGSRPTHPGLLDWLASDFRNKGWNIKRLHRQIVSSATYRQSSRISPEKLERDPENLLYARGPRYRLPSWMIRDQALAASGLLVEQIGGPPVKPYQPDGVWADFSFGNKKYKADSGAALYRRSLYTFWRRIIGPTMFFDAAKRQTCVVKSSRTNTPLHALATLNDVTYTEAARAMAERMMLTSELAGERLSKAFLWTIGRTPHEDELIILKNRLKHLLDTYGSKPAKANALLSEGQHSSLSSGLNPIEHAAYTAICSLILNLDETLSKQ